jgi:hypothetical protein
MLDWLFRKRDRPPVYSLLLDVPDRGLPQALAHQEASDDHDQYRNRIESDLYEQQWSESDRGFATFLKSGNGLLTFALPDCTGKVLLVFSSPVRAADYARVQASGKALHYFCSTPEEVVHVVREFRDFGGVTHIALNRCPRCETCSIISASSLTDAAKAITFWKIYKATERTRLELYWAYALSKARAGELLEARDVALQIVGHVTMEDSRSHVLLGKLAIVLRDRTLLREARRFLVLLKQEEALEDLRASAKAGRCSF